MIFQKLIDKGGRALGIDLDYFVRGGFWTSIPTFLDVFMNLLIAVIFTRVWPMNIYGEYQFFLSVFFILSLLSLPGIGTAIIQSVARKHYRTFIDGKNAIMKFSLLGSLSFLFVAGYFYYVLGRYDMAFYFVCTAFIFPSFYAYRTCYALLLGTEEFDKLAKYQSTQILLMKTAVVLAIVLSTRLTTIILTYLIAGAVSNFIIYHKIKAKYEKKISKSKKDSGLSKYGLHLTLMQIVPSISSHIDKILITYFIGFKALAVYTIAISIAQQNKLPMKPFTKLLLPRLSKYKNPKKTYLFLRKKLPHMIGISLMICLAGIILSPFVIRILFPGDYAKAIVYAQVLFVGQIFMLANLVFSNYLTSQKMTKSLYKSTIIPDVIRMILLLALLPIIGLWGAIISEIGRNYSLFGVTLYLSQREAHKKQ